MKRIISVIVTATIMAGMTFPVSAESNLDWWCTVCENLGGNPDCDCYILGDVNGDGVVDYLDARAILLYSGKRDSDFKGDLRSRRAACIVNREEYEEYENFNPTVKDAVEILKFLAGLESDIPFDGNNPNRLFIAIWNIDTPPKYPVRAEIDIKRGIVSYILTEDFKGEMILYNKIEYDSEISYNKSSWNNKIQINSSYFSLSPRFNPDLGIINVFLDIEFSDDKKVPVGTVITTYEFEGITLENVNSIELFDVMSVEYDDDGVKVNAVDSSIKIKVLPYDPDWWCEVCQNLGGNPDCDCYILGDVNGDGVVDFLDLHEIMHYSAKLPSIFTTGAPSIYTGGDVIYDGLRTHKAACIVNREKYMDAGGYPWIFDALEICKFMAGLDSKIPFDGNNPNRFPIAVQNDFIPRDYPVRAVIDDYSGDDGGLVRFILTEDYSGFIAFHYEITGGADVKFFAPSGPPNSRYLPDGLQSYFAWNNPKGVVNSLIYLAEYPDGGKVPAGTVILSQEFEGATHETFRKIKISDVVSAGDNGDGWKVNETKPYKDVSYITCETEGCKPCGNPARAVGDVDGDGVITIQDAVEIMRYLAKLKSDIDNNDFAYKAACVRGGDSPGIKDALAIMKILAKV